MMLRNEVGRSILSRREGGAVDDAPKLAIIEDQRILHRWELLVKAYLVFVEVLSPHEASFVVGFLSVTISVETRYLAALHAVPADVIEGRATAIDQNHRFDDLLAGKLGLLFDVVFGVLFSLLWFNFWFGLLLRLRAERFTGHSNRDNKRSKSYEGQKSTKQNVTVLLELRSGKAKR